MKPSVTQLLSAVSIVVGSGLSDSIPDSPLNLTHPSPGKVIKSGTELRILCAGDSITLGRLSDQNGGDGNGYRYQLQQDLSNNDVVFAGTLQNGNMTDGYFAAWGGKTIKYISDHLDESLEQRPNIVLIHAGTNDMDDRPQYSTEGNDPTEVADRLGDLIDHIIKKCPDAVILVAIIINSCNSHQAPQIPKYRSLIPGVVQKRLDAGHHVLAVDFSMFPRNQLQDCIHPSNKGYKMLGDYWYDYITQIPTSWINDPVGDDPVRDGQAVAAEKKESEAADTGVLSRPSWLIIFPFGTIALHKLLI
ncbi:SGNH hydrolase-type esterase domain-containing protein [Mariannaea sp. PMI_226]|nr:SGNH hydrolase-type esterase domain-containing protein [Mariannaea sp. PMI_226]